MFESNTLLTFAVAAFLLIILPGPSVLYVITRAVDQGHQAGLASVLGIAGGSVVHTIPAALGISAILATSATAFMAIKFMGAAYLVYLGINTLLGKAETNEEVHLNRRPLASIFSQGVVVNTFNPKAALFFLAFLPQFVDPARGSAPAQIVVLGLIFVVLALIVYEGYAMLAGQFGQFLRNSESFRRRKRLFSGSTYILLGVAAAVSGTNAKS